MKLNHITGVDRGCPLEGKAFSGDRLLSINGNEITDVLDYKYWSYDARLDLELENAAGQIRHVRVSKAAGEDLGLEFETYLMSTARGCANKCLFCFVDQLPKHMRRTLYFKDDDARLSFLTGNYITLTNLSEREIQRICDLKVSPINVSVHATDPALRAQLLGNPAGARGMEILERFARAGIVMDCQIVCCPGYNDGAQLQRSMEELSALYPQVNSVSIVPVGLTRYREGLHPLTPFDRASAETVIGLVEAFSGRCLEKYGSRIFFCSDELYIKAGRALPDDEFYESYSQLENGVGMLRLLITEFEAELRFTEPEEAVHAPFTIATGVSAAPYLEALLASAREKLGGALEGQVCAVENEFFGHSIDVAGLITGRDLIARLRGRALGERLLIPQNMLRHGEGVFLDDVTLKDVRQALGVPVQPVMQDGGALLRAMLGVPGELG